MARTSKLKKTRKRKVIKRRKKVSSPLSTLYIIAGIFLLIVVVAVKVPTFLFTSNTHNRLLVQSTDIPRNIAIQNVLPPTTIIPGYIKNDEWSLATSSALFLAGSGTVGQSGNVVIYGHNTENVFGRLINVQKGQVIEITTQDKKTYKYKVEEIKTVLPTNVEILNTTHDSRLTLFTCAGLFDSLRLVVVGKLV